MTKQRGFSLIELLIVVAVILIIAAIAIPSILRARMAANESAAIANMRTIFTAEEAYDAQGWNNPTAVGYSSLLKDLGNNGACTPPSLNSACLLEDNLANSTIVPRTGYLFTYAPTTVGGKNIDFKLNADPVQRGLTGTRSFVTNQSGAIRFNITQPAQLTDPAIQ